MLSRIHHRSWVSIHVCGQCLRRTLSPISNTLGVLVEMMLAKLQVFCAQDLHPAPAAGGKGSRDSSRCVVQGIVDVVHDKEWHCNRRCFWLDNMVVVKHEVAVSSLHSEANRSVILRAVDVTTAVASRT